MPFPTLITYTGFWSWTAVAIFCFLNFLLGFDLVLPFFFWLFKKEKENLKTKIHIKLTETLFRCIFFLKRKIKSVQLRKLQCKINPLAVLWLTKSSARLNQRRHTIHQNRIGKVYVSTGNHWNSSLFFCQFYQNIYNLSRIATPSPYAPYASPHFYLSENSPTPTSLRFLTTWIVGPLTGAHLSFYLLKIH